MNTTKEVANKIRECGILHAKINKLSREIRQWADENGCADVYVDGFSIEKKSKGERQKDGSYRDQTTHVDGTGYGYYYIPIKESNQYVCISYTF